MRIPNEENSNESIATVSSIATISSASFTNASSLLPDMQKYSSNQIKLLLETEKLGARKVQTTSKNGQLRLNVSPIWDNYFQIYEKKNNNDIGNWYLCMRCMEPIMNTYAKGTTTRFHRHDKKCTKANQMDKTHPNEKINVAEKHLEILKEAACRFTCDDLQPYSAIDGAGMFELLFAAVQIGKSYPDMTKSEFGTLIPGRMTVQRVVSSKVDGVKAIIQKKLLEAIEVSDGFSCTTDLWTDKYRQKCYISITAHLNRLSNEGIVAERLVICMEELEADSKTKEVIEDKIFDVLISYGLSYDQICELIHFITDRGSQFKALDNFNRSNCVAHMINNIVQKMCSESEIQKIISDGASLVRYMKRSGMNSQRKLALKSYSKTRWSTVFVMLESILNGYNTVFELLERRQRSGIAAHRNCLDRIECLKRSTLMKIVEFLKPFKEWTDRIEGDVDVTIHHVWPTFIQINDHLAITYDIEIEEDEDFRLIEAMKCLGRNYVSSISSDISPTNEQRIAVVLHPRMKKLRRMTNQQRDEIYSKINTIIENQTADVPHLAIRRKIDSRPASLDEFIDSDDESGTNSPYSLELTKYLNERVPKGISPNLRAWWFENRKQFPTLFKLFLRISCIPASSAPAERSFSTTGAVVTDRRSSLLPKSVSNIMLVRNLYRN